MPVAQLSKNPEKGIKISNNSVKIVLKTLFHLWWHYIPQFVCSLGQYVDAVQIHILGMEWCISVVREGVQMKKTFLNGHCPFRGGGGKPLPGWFGPFFIK